MFLELVVQIFGYAGKMHFSFRELRHLLAGVSAEAVVRI